MARHLIVTIDFPPRVDGGIATLMEALAEGLAHHGEEVLVATPARPLAAARYGVHTLWGRSWRTWHPLWLQLQLPRLCRRFGADVVHLAEWRFAPCIEGVGARVVVWTHGRELLVAESTGGQAEVSHVLGWADVAVATHAAGAGWLGRFGAPEGRVRRVPPGLPASSLGAEGQGERFRRRFGVGAGPLLLTLGRLVARKGQADVVALLPRLRARVPGLRYVIAGKGPEEGRLREQVRAGGLEGEVVLTGFLSPAERADAYAACDAYVMAVRDPGTTPDVEGFGLTYAEAGWHRRPVVAAATGGVPDAVEHGVSGLLVPPGDPGALEDALVQVLTDPDLAARLGEGGRRRVLEWGNSHALAARVLAALR